MLASDMDQLAPELIDIRIRRVHNGWLVEGLTHPDLRPHQTMVATSPRALSLLLRAWGRAQEDRGMQSARSENGSIADQLG